MMGGWTMEVSDLLHKQTNAQNMKIIISLFCLFILSYSCYAQLPDEVQKKVNNKVDKQTYSPQGKSSIISAYSNLNFTSTFEDESASATLGFRLGSSSLSGYFEQPFKEKPKKVTLFNQDGMGDGTSIKLAFQHTIWNPKANIQKWEKVRDAFCNDPKNKIKKDSCKFVTLSQLDEKTQKDLVRDVIDFGTPVLIGFAIGFAKSEFDYIIDSMALKPENTTMINKNFRFSVGLLMKKSRLLALSYTYEVKHEAADDPNTFTFPVPGSTLSYSKDVTIGKPAEKKDSRIRLEYRAVFTNSEGEQALAINPMFYYTTNKKSATIELPFYFLNYKKDDKVQGLQGGINVAYTTKLKNSTDTKDKFGISLFISAPFSLLDLFSTK
jgi:hypothetical protein